MCKLCETSFSGSIDLPRRKFLALLGAAVSTPLYLRAAEPLPKPQNAITPHDALERLLQGNDRYVRGEETRHAFSRERAALVEGQNPFAALLTCSDSRIAPEFIFDTGLGDLFIGRIAGNYASDDIVASFEYAVEHLNTPLILVLGHESCGAVTAAVKEIRDGVSLPGHLPLMIKAIAPAVESVKNEPGDLLKNAIRQNVLLTVQKLQASAPVLSQAVDEHKLEVVGGVYNLHSGKVDLV